MLELLFNVKSFKSGLVSVPDFILVSLTNLKLLLKSNSCFLEKSTLDVFDFIEKYSSCKDELYGDSQNASSINSIEAQFLKSYSAYSVKNGK
jgi:hypothetical protein